MFFFCVAKEAVVLRSLGVAEQGWRSRAECYNLNMYYVYILKNLLTGEHYTGFSENLKNRVKSHHEKTVKTTKSAEHTLIFYSAFENKAKALEFEKYLKHGSGYAFARKHLV